TGYVYSSYVTTDTSSSTASSLSSSSTSAGEAIVAEAKKYLGVSYVYGGTSPSGFDCSGLVYYVYKQCGYSITRTASSQNSDGTYVSRDNLQPGDIIVFYNSAMTAIGHVGIYIGDGQFIHASSGSGKVVISDLSSTYYNSHYYSARRIVS
ncbi:MAG: C40 family peptidase, partial [Oscillospiraceae bacterium]|nr:C40 family peptidase [Oscillospiraceae bacterium]